jgi:two-component system chemotaxis response regulator CheY
MKLRALVIDDSKLMRSMVMQSVRQTGLADFEFTEAVDGADGLRKFNARTTDIVFVDWNMPNMSGIDFVRKVRRAGGPRRVPIVMVTSERTMGKIEAALDQAGADAFVTKPFTIDGLKRSIEKLVETAKAATAEVEEKPAGGGGFFSRLLSGG